MDTHTPQQRSYNMSQIKYRNTKPEISFRRLVWSKGIRGYRVKAKITGKPDLYFSKKKIAVFIDGCFWHKCPVCFVKPKSNLIYWNKKIKRNVDRDKKINSLLQNDGIRVIRIWEHEVINSPESAFKKLKNEYEKET